MKPVSVFKAGESLNTPTPWFSYILITAIFLGVSNQWSMSDASSMYESQLISVASGDRIRRLLIPILGLFGFLDLIRPRRRRPILHGMLSLWIVSFVGWAVLSLFWADYLGLPVRRGIVFLALGLCALSIATRVSIRDVGWLMFLSSGTFLLASIIWELKSGRFDNLGPGYRFSGTFVSNLQGINCFFVSFSSMFLGDSSRKRRTSFYVAAIVGFGFLLLTKSRTGFAAALLAILAYKALIWKGSRRVKMTYWIIFILMVLLLLFGEDFLQAMSGGVSLGRGVEGGGATLNGRIPLWTECLRYWLERPLLGYGFNGFWTVDRMADVSSLQRWSIGSGHSIYIDVLLELGAVGLFLFIGVLALAVRKALQLLVKCGDVGFAFVFGFLVFVAAEGLMESQFLTPSYIAFMVMVFLAHLGFSKETNLEGRDRGFGQGERGVKGV